MWSVPSCLWRLQLFGGIFKVQGPLELHCLCAALDMPSQPLANTGIEASRRSNRLPCFFVLPTYYLPTLHIQPPTSHPTSRPTSYPPPPTPILDVGLEIGSLEWWQVRWEGGARRWQVWEVNEWGGKWEVGGWSVGGVTEWWQGGRWEIAE